MFSWLVLVTQVLGFMTQSNSQTQLCTALPFSSSPLCYPYWPLHWSPFPSLPNSSFSSLLPLQPHSCKFITSLLPVLQWLYDLKCFPHSYAEATCEAGVCIPRERKNPVQIQLPRTMLAATFGNYSDQCMLFDNTCNSHGGPPVNWLETTSEHTWGSIFCIYLLCLL